MTDGPDPIAKPGPGLGSTVHLRPGEWATVFEFLCARFATVPRDQWASRIARGRVLDTAGRAIGLSTPYRAGLAVRYFREIATESPIPFSEAIVHADSDLVVADKPHFLPVAPVGAWVEETLLARLTRRLGNADLVALHRIDRATAGLVLFSANPATRARYQALFRERRIIKTYEALAPPLTERTFPLEHRSRIVPGVPFFRMREHPGPPNSETRVAVLERGARLWRYELAPVTGRKHQLRLHMASLGAPIANDRYYPELSPVAADDYARPLALLAKALEFVDPLTAVRRRFTSGLRLLSAADPV